MNDPLDETLHRALQLRRAAHAGSEPDFPAMLQRARALSRAPRPRTRSLTHWLLPAAAACVILGVVLHQQRTAPSLSALVADIAAEHQRYSDSTFGHWSPPSDAFGPAFLVEP